LGEHGFDSRSKLSVCIYPFGSEEDSRFVYTVGDDKRINVSPVIAYYSVY
jgi:hypothetical protein